MRRIGQLGRAVLDAGAQPVRSIRRSADSDLGRVEPRRRRHHVMATLAAALVFVLALVVGVVVHNWIPLVVVVATFSARAAFLAWQARPGRGRGDELPIGGLRAGPEGITQIDHYSRRATRYGAVFKTTFYERPACCIVDVELAGVAMREHARDLGPPWDPPGRFVPGGSIRGAEGERSAELRRLYAGTLTAVLVRSWEPVFRQRMSEAVNAWAREQGAATTGVNPRPAIRKLVRGIWCEVLLGIGPDTPEFAATNALLRDLDPDLHLYGRAMPDRDVELALDHLAELIRGACATRDRSLVGATWAERFEEQAPGSLADRGHVRNLIYTVVTSYDDVTGLLAWVLWYLADQPKWVQELRTDPTSAGTLGDRIVSETLRLAQSEFVIREAQTDVRIAHAVVPRGWLVRACLRESHRDPAKFEQPETFDPDRFLGDRVGRDRYSPFGVDHRFCLGEQLTRTAGRVFALALADEVDVVTRRDGRPELGVKRHWAPSSRWLLEMRPRIGPSTDSAVGGPREVDT